MHELLGNRVSAISVVVRYLWALVSLIRLGLRFWGPDDWHITQWRGYVVMNGINYDDFVLLRFGRLCHCGPAWVKTKSEQRQKGASREKNGAG